MAGYPPPKAGRRRARSTVFGFYHDAVLDPLDPRPGEPVTINAQAGAGVAVAAATLHYTVDGSPPDSAAGAAGGRTTSVAMQRTQVAWDTEHWTYIEGWSAVIPGQPDGRTRPLYRFCTHYRQAPDL